MSDTIWKVMVDVQIARRNRDDVRKFLESETAATKKAPRRKRPSTLRSIRACLIDDHYALLAAGKY